MLKLLVPKHTLSLTSWSSSLEITKVIGATVVMVSVIVAVYFHRAGRNDALGTAIWFVFAGALTFSLEWLAEQVGLVKWDPILS